MVTPFERKKRMDIDAMQRQLAQQGETLKSLSGIVQAQGDTIIELNKRLMACEAANPPAQSDAPPAPDAPPPAPSDVEEENGPQD